MAMSSAEPIGGIDYPIELKDFEEWFDSEEACRDFIKRIRWLDGFQCPACGCTEAWETKRKLYRCAACQRQTSITSGTLFEGTRKPLRQWLRVMWYVTERLAGESASHTKGASALEVQRIFGFGSYQTAWTWLHKIRRAMVRPGTVLSGKEIEVGVITLGRPVAGFTGKKGKGKTILAIAADSGGHRTGHIRLERLQNASAKNLISFVQSVASSGATIYTNDQRTFIGLKNVGFKHQPKTSPADGNPANIVLPHIERVTGYINHWWKGIHHGAISASQLDYYLDEFTFRFNRQRYRGRGLLFYKLVQQAVRLEAVSYKKLVRRKVKS